GVVILPSFSPDSRRLGVQIPSVGRQWRVIEIPSLKNLFTGYGGWDRQISPDGERFANAASGSDAIYVGRVAQEDAVQIQYSAGVNHIAFSPDSRQLVVSSDDSFARILDLSTRRTCGPTLRHKEPVLRAAWSSDGRLLATACKDKTARVWSAKSGDPVTPPLIHGGEIQELRFSSDTKWLLTIDANRTVRVWNLPLEERPTKMLGLLSTVAGDEADPGETLNAAPTDAASAWSLLRSKYMTLMTNSPQEVKRWHESESEKAAR